MSNEERRSMITWFMSCYHAHYILREIIESAVYKLKENASDELRNITLESRDISQFLSRNEKSDAMLTVPMAINLGFSLELGLKVILYKYQSEEFREHNLSRIFKRLPLIKQNDLKSKAIQILDCSSSEFDECLLNHSRLFEEWRYGFSGYSNINININNKFAETLLNVIKADIETGEEIG